MIEDFMNSLNSIWLIIGLLWPLILIWFIRKLFTPAFNKYIEKHIDLKSDSKLEHLKNELQADYSTLKTSVDVLSTNHSAMHPHIIEAIKFLWSEILTIREHYNSAILFDAMITSEERQNSFKQDTHSSSNILEIVNDFRTETYQNNFITKDNAEIDKCRLFCGDRVWFIFFTYRALLLRSGLLISWSFRDKKYHDWKQDSIIEQLLSEVIGKEKFAALQKETFGGLTQASSYIESEFLKEAAYIMSGSKIMAENLSDI
jgi:hypothetical protein